LGNDGAQTLITLFTYMGDVVLLSLAVALMWLASFAFVAVI
jgi:hypothetical protein